MPTHADWIIAEDLALRLGHDLGFGSLEEMWDEIRAVSPRHAGITASALAGEHDGVVTTAPPATFAVEPSDTAAPPLKGYGFRLAVGRKLYDAGVALHAVAVAGRAGAGRRASTSTRGTPTASASRTAPRSRWSRRRARSSSRSPATVACPGAWPGSSSNQPDVEVNRLLDDDLGRHRRHRGHHRPDECTGCD